MIYTERKNNRALSSSHHRTVTEDKTSLKSTEIGGLISFVKTNEASSVQIVIKNFLG